MCDGVHGPFAKGSIPLRVFKEISNKKVLDDMRRIVIMLQKLYWERESLKDEAWRLVRKVRSYTNRGKNANGLLVQYEYILAKISEIEKRMMEIEGVVARLTLA